MTQMLKEYAEEVIRGIVDKPDFVEVSEQKGDSTILLKIEAHQSDLGYIIGRKGRVIAALRCIFEAAGAKLKRRVVVELIE